MPTFSSRAVSAVAWTLITLALYATAAACTVFVALAVLACFGIQVPILKTIVHWCHAIAGSIMLTLSLIVAGLLILALFCYLGYRAWCKMSGVPPKSSKPRPRIPDSWETRP